MQNTESLTRHIATLKRLRDAYHGQLDASDLNELDEVLSELTRLTKQGVNKATAGEISLRVLRIIDTAIRLGTNLSELMKWWP